MATIVLGLLILCMLAVFALDIKQKRLVDTNKHQHYQNK